jgi:hypothetical protein
MHTTFPDRRTDAPQRTSSGIIGHFSSAWGPRKSASPEPPRKKIGIEIIESKISQRRCRIATLAAYEDTRLLMPCRTESNQLQCVLYSKGYKQSLPITAMQCLYAHERVSRSEFKVVVGISISRSATSNRALMRADSKMTGRPLPGCVPPPTRYIPLKSSNRFCGRK